MKNRFEAAIVFFVILQVLVFAACGSTSESPSSTEPAASEPTSATEPTTPPLAKVTGTVTYRERIALAPNAVVEVKLIDISRADAPAVTIGEQIIENPGQVPISFEIEYDPSAIDQRFVYAVQVRIIEGDRLAFINDTRYQVITRDSPTQVDMVLVRVGRTVPSEPAAAEPTPTAEPTAPSLAIVTGTVTYRERIALKPNAVVEVKLIDISGADAPAVTIGEQIIENPGQVPISFEIEYDPSAIDQRFVYAVQVRIMEGDRLAFINDTRYQVITRDSPTHVDMVLVRVGRTVP